MYERSASWMVEQCAARAGRAILEPANGHDSVDGADLRAVFGAQDDVAALTWLQGMADEGSIRWLGLNESGLDGPRIAVQRWLRIAAAEVVDKGDDPAAALDRARVRADELLARYAAAPAGPD